MACSSRVPGAWVIAIASLACATASDPGRDSAGDVGQGTAGSDDGSGSTTASASTGGDGPQNCVPGQQIACACPGGTDGAQACLPDGGGYGPCECPDDSGSSGVADSSGGGTAHGSSGGSEGATTGAETCDGCVVQASMDACVMEFDACVADPECAAALQCLAQCGYTLMCAASCSEGIGMISGQIYGDLVNCAAMTCPVCSN